MSKDVVYFVMATNGLIKIGRTKNVEQRMSHIATHSPLDIMLMFTLDGDDWGRTELAIHEYFEKYRIKGEWFLIPADELREFIGQDWIIDVIDEYAIYFEAQSAYTEPTVCSVCCRHFPKYKTATVRNLESREIDHVCLRCLGLMEKIETTEDVFE